jgi:UDP-N-acetylglucosamine 1-carboxyvinyltransferase
MSDERIVIRPSGPLHGEITVPGAKNSVLKLMAATLLADGEYTFDNVPAIADVGIMAELLSAIGVSSRAVVDGELTMVNRGALTPVAPYELVERIRASINVLGPLIGRCGRVTLSLPGGDDFGSRPIDMHIRGLEAMGASFELRHGYVEAQLTDGAERLHGASISLEFPSVGATENILTAAVYAKGTTVIDNAAREPELTDLCNMLVAMGADIEGIDTSKLVIHGVEPGSLRPVRHRVVTDRIQAATYLAAIGVCGGEVVLRGPRLEHMEMLLRRFADMGLTVTSNGDGLALPPTTSP